VRRIPGLLPAFWLDQGDSVLKCKLDQAWAQRFFDETLAIARQPGADDTPAGVMRKVVEIARAYDAQALATTYAERVRAEAPGSGAAEYLEARRLYFEKQDLRGALKIVINLALELALAQISMHADFHEPELPK
jgi:hypothetical protein